MSPSQLTAGEIDRMREIVLAHDKNQPAANREFDLAKPPVVPYRYQEFPRMVYHHAKRLTKTVTNSDHLEDALAAGWSKQPFPVEVLDAAPELDADAVAEAATEAAEMETRLGVRRSRLKPAVA